MKYPGEANILVDIEAIAKRLVPGCEYVSHAVYVLPHERGTKRGIVVSALSAKCTILETWKAELVNADSTEVLVAVRREMTK